MLRGINEKSVLRIISAQEKKAVCMIGDRIFTRHAPRTNGGMAQWQDGDENTVLEADFFKKKGGFFHNETDCQQLEELYTQARDRIVAEAELAESEAKAKEVIAAQAKAESAAKSNDKSGNLPLNQDGRSASGGKS